MELAEILLAVSTVTLLTWKRPRREWQLVVMALWFGLASFFVLLFFFVGTRPAMSVFDHGGDQMSSWEAARMVAHKAHSSGLRFMFRMWLACGVLAYSGIIAGLPPRGPQEADSPEEES